MKEPIVRRFEEEGNPYFSSARSVYHVGPPVVQHTLLSMFSRTTRMSTCTKSEQSVFLKFDRIYCIGEILHKDI